MDKLENKFYQFKHKFEFLSKDEQVKLYNDFCDKNDFKDKKMYPMSKFNEIFANVKPSEIVEMAYHHRAMINPNDDYFLVRDYGFRTSNNPYNDIIQYYLIDIFVSM